MRKCALMYILADDVPEATLHAFFVGKDIEIPAVLALLLVRSQLFSFVVDITNIILHLLVWHSIPV